MKKKLFYFVMAACVALCNISCGGDDGDSNSSGDVNLRTPKYLYNAIGFSITEPQAITANVDDAPLLTKVTFTKSGNAVFELKEMSGSYQYFTCDVASISDNVYTLAGGKGKIVSKATKSKTVNVGLDIDIAIDFIDPFGNKVTIHYTGADIAALGITEDAISNVIQTYLERTWSVDAIILDLEGDISGYKEFKGGSLKQVCDYAISQGAHLSAEEQASFNKAISNIIVDNELFVINYSSGMPDAGGWTWGSSDYSSIRITLKDGKMGNKYINNNSTIALKFSSNMCVMVFKTSVSDGQNYKAALTLRLIDK